MPLLSRLLTLLVIFTRPHFLARLTLIPIKSLSICFRDISISITTILKRRGCLTVPRLTLMSLIKMMLVMVSVAAISKTFGLLRFKDVNSHTVLDGIITTIMATIQRINIIGSREGSRNRRRLKANQTGKKFRVGIKSNISTNRNNLISGVDRCIHLNAMKKTTITSINRQTIKI